MADAEATIEAPPADPVQAPPAPAEPEATEPAKPPKEEKSKKDKKDKKSKKGKEADDELPGGPSVAGHPRAARSVERAKGWGALVGFVLGGYLSLPTHTLLAAGLRALIAGVILYVAVWAASVFFWRRMVMLEIKAREQELLAAVAAARAQLQAGAAEGQPGTRR